MADNTFSVANNAFWFKETYSERSLNSYNSDFPLDSQAVKKYDFQGTKDHVAVPLSEAGGIGGMVNTYLPEGGSDSGEQMEIEVKDHVGVAVVERKAMKAAMTDRGAFVRFTAMPVEKCVESYNTISNILWHLDGNARLARGAASGAYVSGTADEFVMGLLTTTFHERRLPIGHLVELGNSGDTGTEDAIYRIKSVDKTNSRVTLTRKKGSFDATTGVNSRYVYIQNMFQAGPMGLEGTVMATSGNIYTIPYDASNWGALIYDAVGAPPSISMLNAQMNLQSVRVPKKAMPSFLLTSPEIVAILSDIKEGDKTYLMPRDKNLTVEAGFGIAGLSYTMPDSDKVIPIVADKHCQKDRIYGLYSDSIYKHHLPDHGWWDDDGQVFMRVPGRPLYSATYGGHYQNVIHPTFAVVWDNLGLDV